MDNYFIDKISNKPVKIGSKSYIKLLKAKLNDNNESKEILTNISYETYLDLKDNLTVLADNQFYCYRDNAVLVKNKSIKLIDFTKYLENMLPIVIDEIIELMNNKEIDISNVRTNITNIFHNSLIH